MIEKNKSKSIDFEKIKNSNYGERVDDLKRLSIFLKDMGITDERIKVTLLSVANNF